MNKIKDLSVFLKFIIIILILIFIALIVTIFVEKGKIIVSEHTSSLQFMSSDDDSNSTVNNFSDIGTKNTYGYNESFKFDGFEISIGNNLKFSKVKNRFSEYNKQVVVGIPITVKNLSEETQKLNMFYYDVYGSQGTTVEKLNAYFDKTLDYSGNLKPNASYTKYTYVEYDGDGVYSIEFNNYSEKVTVEFEVVKK